MCRLLLTRRKLDWYLGDLMAHSSTQLKESTNLPCHRLVPWNIIYLNILFIPVASKIHSRVIQ